MLIVESITESLHRCKYNVFYTSLKSASSNRISESELYIYSEEMNKC